MIASPSGRHNEAAAAEARERRDTAVDLAYVTPIDGSVRNAGGPGNTKNRKSVRRLAWPASRVLWANVKKEAEP